MPSLTRMTHTQIEKTSQRSQSKLRLSEEAAGRGPSRVLETRNPPRACGLGKLRAPANQKRTLFPDIFSLSAASETVSGHLLHNFVGSVFSSRSKTLRKSGFPDRAIALGDHLTLSRKTTHGPGRIEETIFDRCSEGSRCTSTLAIFRRMSRDIHHPRRRPCERATPPSPVTDTAPALCFLARPGPLSQHGGRVFHQRHPWEELAAGVAPDSTRVDPGKVAHGCRPVIGCRV